MKSPRCADIAGEICAIDASAARHARQHLENQGGWAPGSAASAMRGELPDAMFFRARVDIRREM